MSAELFTVATHPTPGLARLHTSLSKFGVSITKLAEGEAQYRGHGWRWKTLIRAVKASSSDTVVFCDGYDSLCLDSVASIQPKFASLAHPIVFSYEPQAQPEPWLSFNLGLMMADRNALLAVFDDRTLKALFPDHFNDKYQNPEPLFMEARCVQGGHPGSAVSHGRPALPGTARPNQPAG